MSGPAFIDRQVFPEYLTKSYEDVTTIYGDLSRLVVALVARTSPEDIRRLYNELGWGGAANARAIHDAANNWMRQHRPLTPSGDA